jgi:Ca-activated chloride channel family protein
MDDQRPRRVPGEAQTNLMDAVAAGLHRLRAGGARRKVMILLTDGENNETNPASGWDLGRAVRVARAEGVPVYTIDGAGTGVSVEEGEERTVTSPEARRAAEATLRELAKETGGQYFRAENTDALAGVYQAIDRKERTEVESFQYARYYEAYPWLGAAAFALFAAVLSLEMTLWRKVP